MAAAAAEAAAAAVAASTPPSGANVNVRLRDVIAALHADYKHPPSARLLAVAAERLRRQEQGGKGQGAALPDDAHLLRPMEPMLWGFTPAVVPRSGASAGAGAMTVVLG